jgi:hypothetical protein
MVSILMSAGADWTDKCLPDEQTNLFDSKELAEAALKFCVDDDADFDPFWYGTDKPPEYKVVEANPHAGSSLDGLFQELGELEEVEAMTAKNLAGMG